MIQKLFSFLLISILGFSVGIAQGSQDASLGYSFFQNNREYLRNALPDNSIAVLFSSPFQYKPRIEKGEEVVDFEQDPDFFYLTGMVGPYSILVLSKSGVLYKGESYNEILFHPQKDSPYEKYKGLRLQNEGFQKIFATREWTKFCREVIKKKPDQKVYCLPKDFTFFREPGTYGTNEILFDFFQSFQPGFPIDGNNQFCYSLIKNSSFSRLEDLKQKIRAQLAYFPKLRADPILKRVEGLKSGSDLSAIQSEVNAFRMDVVRLRDLLDEIRALKKENEQQLVKKATRELNDIMKDCIRFFKPGLREEEVERYARFRTAEAKGVVFLKSRVASGENSKNPNYSKNEGVIPSDDISVLDLIISGEGYYSKVTRTLPNQGIFSDKDAEIYSSLLAAHKESIKMCTSQSKVSRVPAVFNTKIKVMEDKYGMKGHLKGVSAIGLNEYDPLWGKGGALENRGVFEVGHIVMVESGVQSTKKGNPKGFELRDLVLVTSTGPIILTEDVPFEIAEIQKLIKEEVKKGLKIRN